MVEIDVPCGTFLTVVICGMFLTDVSYPFLLLILVVIFLQQCRLIDFFSQMLFVAYL